MFFNKKIIIIVLAFYSAVNVHGKEKKVLQSIGVIDYRSAYIFEPDSLINKLFIKVSSRLTLKDSFGERSYILLKEHPRESTFSADLEPYRQLVDQSGASFITFIYGVGVDSVVVSRRYAYLNEETQPFTHECRLGKYEIETKFQNLKAGQVTEFDEDNIFDLPKVTGPFFGIFRYFVGDTEVDIDFPIALINFNPKKIIRVGEEDLLFQVVSDQVPIYLPGKSDECGSIVPGYMAFRKFDGSAQIVYLCKKSYNGKDYYDYGCVIDLPGKLSVYALP